MAILVIADHNNIEVSAGTLSSLLAAQQLGGEIAVLVVGQGARAAADHVASAEGVFSVLHCDNALYAQPIAENLTPLICSLAPAYTHILFAASNNGKNLMPRVAALLDVAGISDVIAVESDDTFVRPIYAGNALATVKSHDSQKVMTIRATAFDAVATGSNSATVSDIEVGTASDLVKYIGADLSVSNRPELTSARIVISGGRGMQNGDNFKMLDRIAEKLNAAVGASRAAVDAGFVSNDYQVGQTGKVVAPDLYIAVGISGAIQHLAGMKDSKVIVAINKDEDAPIFQVADYGLVADLFDVLPELEAAL